MTTASRWKLRWPLGVALALALLLPGFNPCPVQAQETEEEEVFDEEPLEDEFVEDEESLDEEALGEDSPQISHPDEFYQLDDNPLNPIGDNLDLLIQTQINADLWAAMMGDLPCLDPTTECIAQLQSMAVENNLALTVIQERIDVIEQRIDEARDLNQQAVQIDIFDPLLSRYLQFDQSSGRGFLDNLFGLFTNPLSSINEILSLIGMPLLRGVTNTNTRAQQTTLAISDLQVKVTQIEQEKRKMAETLREQVMLEILEFDATRREFQISQEIARRATVQHRLLEVDYRFSDRIDSVTYLGHLSQLDRQKADTYRAWARLRTRLARIQMMVLGQEE
ncbi:hypothetical protein [Phormidium sp. FACHB-1136]|uniref:hypothetical protein n=1 Tax=Phormidium sp. FACHB-1136 TaxID=2692848 RepID=UPI001681C330|nr:hypothetical protein [Phormidium sp. FACHB-1136]MBD2425439.1 hypothetical protein [Phormidium sp. FACHB-1136]